MLHGKHLKSYIQDPSLIVPNFPFIQVALGQVYKLVEGLQMSKVLIQVGLLVINS